MTFTAEGSGRLDLAVTAHLPELSRSQAARLVRDGRVQVDGEVVARPATRIRAGAAIEVHLPPPAPADAQPQDLPLRVVYQDADLAVIDKAAGMVVHPGPGHPDGTLVNALLFHLDDLSGVGGEERPGIVHRLDRGTSGLIVVAKHDRAHRHLAAQFADHSAGRTYLALCIGAPDDDRGTVESHLGRHPRDRVRMASVAPSQGRHAITHWEVRARGAGASLVQCRLETGRTHQVRVHLSEQGFPIVGDRTYHRRSRPAPAALRRWVEVGVERPLLHAWRLHLVHPGTEAPAAFVAPPPEDFVAALAVAGLAAPQAEEP